jgi:hypothetical protein
VLALTPAKKQEPAAMTWKMASQSERIYSEPPIEWTLYYAPARPC